jgi:hypothetical protein
MLREPCVAIANGTGTAFTGEDMIQEPRSRPAVQLLINVTIVLRCDCLECSRNHIMVVTVRSLYYLEQTRRRKHVQCKNIRVIRDLNPNRLSQVTSRMLRLDGNLIGLVTLGKTS